MKMTFSKELFFLVVFLLIHANAAINLGFFTFNQTPLKNETNETTLIEPTKSIATSIQISESPTTPTPVRTPLEVNLTLADIIKHEFENETEAVDASPENTTDSKPSTSKPGLDGQEIDETRLSSSYSVKEPVDEEGSDKAPAKLPAAPLIPSFPKVTLPKLPSFPRRKIVNFTTTITSQIKTFKTVYPSCVKLQNVKSVCDGSLVTIQPTPPTVQVVFNARSMAVNGTDYDMFDVIDPPEGRRKRDVNKTTNLKDLKEAEKLFPHQPYLEASELDYQFEEFEDEGEIKSNSQLHSKGTNPISKIASLLALEPKYHIVTEHLTVTSVQTVTNYDATATVVAHNCLPRNLRMKRCPAPPKPATSLPVVSFTPPLSEKDIIELEKKKLEEKKKQKIFFQKPSPSRPPVREPPQTLDTMEQLQEYLIMNANRLINNRPGGFEVVDLNAGSTIIESADAHFPTYHRRRSARVKRTR